MSTHNNGGDGSLKTERITTACTDKVSTERGYGELVVFAHQGGNEITPLEAVELRQGRISVCLVSRHLGARKATTAFALFSITSGGK